MEILHSAIAILGAIVLIIRFKVDPVISLLLACVYLGLATGLGAEGTVAQITGGFGEIMAEVGLLIGFGVLIGALLHAMGTFNDLVEILARRVGRRLPYAMAGTLSTIFPSIYVDVQVVLAAPMAKESAPAVDRRIGLPWLAGAMAIGIFAGYVFVVPGLAAVAIAGLMEVPLGTYLLYGLPIGLTTALVTTFLFRLLLGRDYWNDKTDFDPDMVLEEGRPHDEAEDVPLAEGAARLPLWVRLLPILVPLVLIATGAIAGLAEVSNPVLAFLGDANIALFVGLLIAFGMVRPSLGADGVGTVLTAGFHTTGEILLVTGVGGSLGAVIAESGMDETLIGPCSPPTRTRRYSSASCSLGSSPRYCTSRSGRCRSGRSPPRASSRRSSARSGSTPSSLRWRSRRAPCSRSTSTATSSGCSAHCSTSPPRAA